MNQSVLFLSLRIFSVTGGIERVCRVLGKALYENGLLNNQKVRILSMYDNPKDAFENYYFPSEIFKGFGLKKVSFILSSIKSSFYYDTVLLSHVNLLPVGWVIKWLYPKKKLILMAHGIEVWNELPKYKRKMLGKCDLIVSVSHFTAGVVMDKYLFPKKKLAVLNNCLDPFLSLGKEYRQNGSLRESLGYTKKEKIFFTLARISSKERYKGYDKVMEALAELKNNYPEVRYIIAGNYDNEEKDNITGYARELGVLDKVNVVGFVSDADLVSYFSMVDFYIMPSLKEGFGIVFIEAMFYGLPVIAGNRDGSVDALCGGDLGILVDPIDRDSVRNAMQKVLENKNKYVPNRDLLLKEFSYDSYKYKLDQILSYD